MPSSTNLRKKHAESLYVQQGGKCNGCAAGLGLRQLTLDHVVARSVGGTDDYENLQLLCLSCNSIKNARGMDYLRWALAHPEKVEARKKENARRLDTEHKRRLRSDPVKRAEAREKRRERDARRRENDPTWVEKNRQRSREYIRNRYANDEEWAERRRQEGRIDREEKRRARRAPGIAVVTTVATFAPSSR